MCGILLIVTGVRLQTTVRSCSGPDSVSPTFQDFQKALRARGPDRSGRVQVQAASGVTLDASCSALQLRGTSPVHVPHQASNGSFLLFNGEVFGGVQVPAGGNDGAALLAALSAPGADPAAVLSAVRGPWALTFWDAPRRTVWFGRDTIGRRSLLAHFPDARDGRLILASMAAATPCPELPGVDSSSGTYWQEVSPGLHTLQLTDSKHDGKAVAALAQQPWQDPLLSRLRCCQRPAHLILSVGALQNAGSTASHERSQEQAVQQVLAALQQAVAVRCSCMDTLSPVSHQAPRSEQPSPEANPALGNLTADQHGPRRCTPAPTTNAASEDAGCNSHSRSSIPTSLPSLCAAGAGSLNGCAQPALAAVDAPLSAAPVLILFSGGMDSTLIAALAHAALPADAPIDLATICFDAGNSPDRLAALDALEELAAFAPGREWRLIEMDRSMRDVDAARPQLLQLLEPCATVMDLNIGAALWLAAEGAGTLRAPSLHRRSTGRQWWNGRQYRSSARVVLVGHGADEQCAGYGRHRTKFRTEGMEGLAAELAEEMQRLWLRNLGRDDRLIASRGREARHPFLDEHVVATLLDCPLHCIADLTMPAGQGDKLVLRRCLQLLGLPRASSRVKRAIQFGTRLSKLTNQQMFGSNRAANLQNAGSVALRDM